MIKRLTIFVIIVSSLFLIGYYYPLIQGYFILDEKNIYEKEKVFFERAIDGDTIEVINSNREKYKVRLLGINTPEKKKEYSNLATGFLKRFENNSVYIMRDFEDMDLYDRKLRYLFYEDRFINLEILEQGLATSFITEGLYYEDKMLKAEKYAMENEIGLWERSNDKCSSCIILYELNKEEEYFILENQCDFECRVDGWDVKDAGTHFFNLENDIPAGKKIKIESKKNVWNNDGDRFFLRDDKGKLVVFYEY